MKFVLMVTTLLAAGTSLIAADSASAVTFVDHSKVADALSKTGTLVSTPDFIVLGSFRDKAGQVEMHEKETDVVYVVDGAATFVTGGTGVGMTRSRPGQWLGSDIKGGETHHLTKGDIIVVPAGIPHWFKAVNPSISYSVVKVIKP